MATEKITRRRNYPETEGPDAPQEASFQTIPNPLEPGRGAGRTSGIREGPTKKAQNIKIGAYPGPPTPPPGRPDGDQDRASTLTASTSPRMAAEDGARRGS